MSEPIYLYNADGEALAVYTRAQAEVLLAAGEWFATAADAKAGKVRSEPTPTVDEKLTALEGGAGIVMDDAVTESPAPAAPRKVSKGKGKL